MRHTNRIASSLAGLTLIYAAGASVAHAETTTCAGTIGAVTLDNVVVQDGSVCTLQGTRLNGTIYVMTRAALNANMVRVNGNIQAEGARSVVVNPRSRVGGNIQIKQGLGAKVDGVLIGGDLQVEQNRRLITLTRNRIDGNLQAFQNTGGLRISSNVIAENLQCKENNPPPTGGNNAAGSKEDQCARL